MECFAQGHTVSQSPGSNLGHLAAEQRLISFSVASRWRGMYI